MAAVGADKAPAGQDNLKKVETMDGHNERPVNPYVAQRMIPAASWMRYKDVLPGRAPKDQWGIYAAEEYDLAEKRPRPVVKAGLIKQIAGDGVRIWDKWIPIHKVWIVPRDVPLADHWPHYPSSLNLRPATYEEAAGALEDALRQVDAPAWVDL